VTAARKLLVTRSNTTEQTLMINSELCAQFADPVRYHDAELMLYSNTQMCCENGQQDRVAVMRDCSIKGVFRYYATPRVLRRSSIWLKADRGHDNGPDQRISCLTCMECFAVRATGFALHIN